MSVAAPSKPTPQPKLASVPEEIFHRRRWTVQEYQRAASLGLFRPDERLELLQGEIIEKMPPNPPHSNGIDYVKAALSRAFASISCYQRTENPIAIPEDLRVPNSSNQPQPDIVIVPGVPADYRGRFPGPQEVLLLVEVADSSVESDRTIKGAIYATAGIREYWILNLQERQLEVHQDPTNGEWTTTFTVPESGTVSPLANPQATVAITDLLP